MSIGCLKGLGLLQLQVIHLISKGEQENMYIVEKHMKEGDIIEYLLKKYRNSFFVSFDNDCYDNKALNTFFQEKSVCIIGEESRKYGIMNEKDGLLIILALIGDLVECYSPQFNCLTENNNCS